MKKKQYLHEISPEILTNKDLLQEWFAENQDMSIFGLTAEILYNDKLFFEWLKKLQNPSDFFDSLDEEKINDYFENFKNDIPDEKALNIDVSYIDKLIDSFFEISPTIDLMDKDKINSGISVDELNSFKDSERERIALNLAKETKNYTFSEKLEYSKNIIPFLIEIMNKNKKEYFEQKSKALLEYTEVKNEVINVKPLKINEKWFALLYWIELMATGKQPPKSNEGTFIKSEIEQIGRKYTGTSGQSFYRNFIKIDLNNEKIIKNSFGFDWKNRIIELSNYNAIVIDYLNAKYN